MLTSPQNSSPLVNIVGLDPGSNAFGIAVLTIDINTMKIVSSIAWTIFGERLSGKNNWIEEIHSGRINRILAIEENLLQVFNYYNPFLISSEAPFINNAFPQAGIALTEVLFCIRQAVMRYDQWKRLDLIPPSNVKNAVGASGGGDKNKVRDKVIVMSELNFIGNTPIEELDEHSIDALAVAYSRYKSLI